MFTLKGFSCRDELVFGPSAGPRGDQEEVAAVAPAEVHELRRQISAAVYRQQQQLQHPDLHAGAVQPQNAPGFVLLPRRPLQHMSPTGGGREHDTPSCKTSQKTKDVRLKNIYHTHSCHLHIHCWYNWWFIGTVSGSAGPSHAHYSSITLKWFGARAQLDPSAVTRSMLMVSRVSGVRWAVLTWKCAKWYNYALIKKHSVDFPRLQMSAAAAWTRPIKEMEFMQNPFFSFFTHHRCPDEGAYLRFTDYKSNFWDN